MHSEGGKKRKRADTSEAEICISEKVLMMDGTECEALVPFLRGSAALVPSIRFRPHDDDAAEAAGDKRAAKTEVFTWGSGATGSLMTGSEENSIEPQGVPRLSRVRIVDVACSVEHSIAVTDTGEIYASGMLHHSVLCSSYTPEQAATMKARSLQTILGQFFPSLCTCRCSRRKRLFKLHRVLPIPQCVVL